MVCSAAAAQETDSSKRNFKTFPLPILSYSPETRGTFGAVALSTFRFKNEPLSSRNSQFEVGAAYTQEDQWFVYMPFDLYLKNEKWYLKGITGYYDFSYFFYGIGNEATNEQEELYNIDYFRFRIDAMNLLRPHLYVGIRYWMEDYKVKDVAEGGQLAGGQISGFNGGTVSTAGLISLWDTRNNYNYPSKGHLLQTLLLNNSKTLGSDFNFNRLSFDYSNYFSLGDNIIATNLYMVAMNGDPPFNELAFIGGRNKMRGYYLGRYRNMNLAMVQAEYRRTLFWRVGMAAFIGSGNVSPDLQSFAFKNTVSSGGIGLRYMLDTKEKINVRFDYAIGEDGSDGFYVAFREAF